MKAILIYWQGLDRREQHFAIIGSVLFLLCILYFGLVSPLQSKGEQANRDLTSERNLFSWLSNKAGEIEILRAKTGNSTQVSTLALNQAVTESVKPYNLEIDRLQPQQNELEVWLKPMPFNSLLKWLDHLSSKYGVQVKFIDISKTDTQGVVEVKRLKFGRG